MIVRFVEKYEPGALKVYVASSRYEQGAVAVGQTDSLLELSAQKVYRASNKFETGIEMTIYIDDSPFAGYGGDHHGSGANISKHHEADRFGCMVLLVTLLVLVVISLIWGPVPVLWIVGIIAFIWSAFCFFT